VLLTIFMLKTCQVHYVFFNAQPFYFI
jgi:hypothetical protein